MSPFLLAVLLANLAERSQNWRIFQYIYLLLLNSIVMLFGFGSIAMGVLSRQPNAPDILPPAYKMVDWSGAGLALLIAGLIALVLLAPKVRRLAARVIPIDPKSMVHATALSLSATAIGLNLFQMSLNRILLTPEGLSQVQKAGDSIYVDAFVFPLLVLSLAGLLGVGWLTRRSWSEVVERLGLTVPTLPQLGLAAGVTVGLIVLAFGADRLWGMADPAGQKEVGSIMSALMRNVNGLSGAFAIGITAAIGEEFFFRGAYQKRMGILLTALLFASFHTQYFISVATLLIFVIGLVLGVLRQRTTLAVCILVHFSYNFISVLLGS
jgi:membrane protease YdiL (CAAX protease family)